MNARDIVEANEKNAKIQATLKQAKEKLKIIEKKHNKMLDLLCENEKLI